VGWLLETAPNPHWVSGWFLGLIIAVLKNKNICRLEDVNKVPKKSNTRF
jgi:hypothetical protein